ncbi:MAG TPA: arginase [Gaiellaceae bacterium]|jgi:arginase|nr:arginase [Gaiellaceae bacterium]
MSAEQSSRPVAVIGAGLDLGQGRRGVDMGPSAIRYAGLQERISGLGRTCVDWGDVEVGVAEATDVGEPNARYLGAIMRSCGEVARRVGEAREAGFLPLVLGGDHSVAMGTLGGMAKSSGPGAVLWIDAHADMNRPGTSPSGNVHGMPLAEALGVAGGAFAADAWPSPSVERVAIVGARSVDAGERVLIAELGVRVFTMSDIDRRGIEGVLREALAYLQGAAFLHASVDLDAVDPMFAPGVGTPVRGGLSYREAHLALELVSESGLLDSLELVEVNPILDEANETAALAVELAASALGARIL